MEINKNLDILKSCRFCPMCKHVCSSGTVSNSESDYPRGRAMIIYGIHKGSLKYNSDLADALYNCFLCGCCWDSCESHYDLPKLIKASRVDMVNLNVAPKEAYEIKDSILEFSNPYGIKDVKPYSGSKNYKKGADYLYYMGADINYFNHEIADAVLKVLDSLKLDYSLMGKEADNGKILSLLGFSKQSKEAAGNLYDEIKKMAPKNIIVSDPLSYDALKNDFKDMGFALEPDIKVMHFSELVSDFSDKLNLKKYNNILGLVDSEYLGRFNNIYEQPRKILKKLAGEKFKELIDNPDVQHSSGEAAFIFKNEKFNAGRMLVEKICNMASEKEITNLVTLSPTTKNYINKNTDCKAIDLAELVAENLK